MVPPSGGTRHWSTTIIPLQPVSVHVIHSRCLEGSHHSSHPQNQSSSRLCRLQANLNHANPLVSSRDSSSRRSSTHYLKYLNTKINSTTNLPSALPDLPLRRSFHSFTTSPVYSLFTSTYMSLPSIFLRRLTPPFILSLQACRTPTPRLHL